MLRFSRIKYIDLTKANLFPLFLLFLSSFPYTSLASPQKKPPIPRLFCPPFYFDETSFFVGNSLDD